MIGILGMVIVSCLNFVDIPKVVVKDAVIESALRAYIDSLEVIEDKTKVIFHLVARIQRHEEKKILYVESVVSTGAFMRNVPDQYSELDNRFVFWYERTEKMNDAEDSIAFQDFVTQFGEHLINDYSGSGVEIKSGVFKLLSFRFIGPYRFDISRNKVKNVKMLCRGFPDPIFFSKGLKYNDYGDAVYQDGVYDVCSLDKPFLPVPEGYDFAEYVKKRASTSLSFLGRNEFLRYTITVDEYGNIISAELDETSKKKVNKELNDRLVDVMLNSPKWNAATARGEKVKYRIEIGLPPN